LKTVFSCPTRITPTYCQVYQPTSSTQAMAFPAHCLFPLTNCACWNTAMTHTPGAVEALCFHTLYKLVQQAYSMHLEFSSGELITTAEHIGKSLYAIFFTEKLFRKWFTTLKHNRRGTYDAKLDCWGSIMSSMDAVDDWALHAFTSIFLHEYLIATVPFHTIHATAHLKAAGHVVAKKWTLLQGITPFVFV